MARWGWILAALSLATLGAGGCDDDGSVTSTGGGGPGGGGGGSTSTTCGPGLEEIPCVDGAEYVVVSDVCLEGSPALDLLRCDACECESAPCTAQGGIYPTDQCMGSNAPFNTDNPEGCYNTSSLLPPDLFVNGTVTTGSCEPTGVPELNVCQLGTMSACSSEGTCVLPGLPICLLLAEGATCPSGFDHAVDVRRDGGTCNCSCVGECPASVSLYTNDTCSSMDPIEVPAEGGCVQAVGVDPFVSSIAPTQKEVPCQASSNPSGGTPGVLCCRAPL